MRVRGMKLQSRVNSLFNSITYRLDSIVIDPGDQQDWAEVNDVLLTHAHFDHIYGLNSILESNPDLKVYTNKVGSLALLDAKLNLSKYHGDAFTFDYPENIIIIEDNEEVKLGNGMFAKAIFTLGHNDSCITWIINDYIFTGDSYIPGVKVVTNLPGGNRVKAAESVERIMKLAEGRIVCPGHKIEVSDE